MESEDSLREVIADTQVCLWFIEDSLRLSSRARQIVADADRVFVSRASVWEIAIKVSLGKLPLKFPLAVLLGEIARNDIEILDITDAHVLCVAALPHHHRDPFDRMIVAQALEEGLPVVSSDAALDAYGVRRVF